jgi:DNA repair protein SbcD/Mre11
MRFIHTADWHIGKTLRGRSRMDEFANALDEVAEVAIDEQADAVLVGGDVFDSQTAAPEAEKLVYDFLARLLPERIACVLIAGNHDNPRKLSALTNLLDSLGIFIRGEPAGPSAGGIVTLPSRDGRETAQIAVLPFVSERRIVDACQLMNAEYHWYEAYSERVAQMLGVLARSFSADTVNVILAHLLISGARVGTGERPLHLGEVYAVNAQQLPDNAQYIGLGHLHRPQEILAPSKTCFAGSLIELDFGEREQDKRVVVIDAKPSRPAHIESVALSAGRKLRDVSGTLQELEALGEQVGSDFLRVRVRVNAPAPGIADRVRELLPNALDVQLDYERQEPIGEATRLGRVDAAELFAEFYEHHNGAKPSEELVRLFRSVYEEASQ